MPEQLKELAPSAPEVLLDKDAPWYAKMLPWLLTYVKANPGISSVILLLGTLLGVGYWLLNYYVVALENVQMKVVGEMKSSNESMEARREKREDVNMRILSGAIDRLTSSHEKVASAVDRNTDAIRGKVFSTRKNDKAEDAKRPE